MNKNILVPKKSITELPNSNGNYFTMHKSGKMQVEYFDNNLIPYWNDIIEIWYQPIEYTKLPKKFRKRLI